MKYKATKDGVLSNPYKRVRAGDVFDLPGEVTATWLVPLDQYEPEPEKPVVPGMDRVAPKTSTTDVPPAPSSEAYDRGMESIKAKEAVEDGESPDLSAPGRHFVEAQPHVEQEEAEEAEGTGNQDVIG